jgi:hypothetical protein
MSARDACNKFSGKEQIVGNDQHRQKLLDTSDSHHSNRIDKLIMLTTHYICVPDVICGRLLDSSTKPSQGTKQVPMATARVSRGKGNWRRAVYQSHHPKRMTPRQMMILINQ